MLETPYKTGLGSWAASPLTVDVARDLIFAASKTYSDKFNHGTSGSELILGLVAPSSQPDVSCCAEEALNEICETLKSFSAFLGDRDMAMAAFLFVSHFELLKAFQEYYIPNQNHLYQLMNVLGLHRDQVWDIAFSIASFADASNASENYTRTLDALYTKLNTI